MKIFCENNPILAPDVSQLKQKLNVLVKNVFFIMFIIIILVLNFVSFQAYEK